MSESLPRGRRLSSIEHDVISCWSIERFRRHVNWFAKLGDRAAGSSAEREAALYVAQELSDSDVAYELQSFPSYVSRPGTPAAVRVHCQPVWEIDAKCYAFSASTSGDGVEGELVYLGAGADADYAQYGSDIHNKIVLIELSNQAPHAEAVRIAQQYPVKGLIVMNWSDIDGSPIHMATAKWVWGNPTPADASAMPRIPVVSISRRAGLELVEMSARERLRVSVAADTSREWMDAIQPIAQITGSAHKFVLLHCHLDSFGPGMTDDVGAIAGLLEVARVLRRRQGELPLSVRIAWWASHEMPYGGSTWYADTHWDELREDCVASLNTDPWGCGDKLVIQGSADLREVLETAVHDATGKLVTADDFGTKNADQSFWGIGVSCGRLVSLMPTGPSMGGWFHSELDTIDKLHEPTVEELAKGGLVVCCRLATTVARIRSSKLARQFVDELRRIADAAPSEAGLDSVVRAVETLAVELEKFEREAGENLSLSVAMQVARVLNPILYSVVGRYGQDPMAATYLNHRLPGLKLALDAWMAGAPEGDKTYMNRGWILRERNRTMDAVADALRIIRSDYLLSPLTIDSSR